MGPGGLRSAERYRVSMTMAFQTDDAGYAWLNRQLGMMTGDFDEKTGSTLWSHGYDCPYGRIGYPAGPRASVTVQDGKAYALGATGRLHVFDAASGKRIEA